MLGTTLIATTALALGAVGGVGPAAPHPTAAPSSSVTVDRAGAVKVGKDLFAIDYDIVNATGQTLTITGSSIDGQWNGTGPIDGHIIAPGFTETLSVVQWITDPDTATVTYAIGDTGQTLDATIDPDIGLNGTTIGGDNGTISIAFPDWIHGTGITLTDTSPTVHDLASGSEAEYQAMNKICTADNMGRCSFVPTGETSTTGPVQLAGSIIPNATKETVQYQYDWGVTTDVTSDWGVSATITAGVEGVASAAISATYGQSYSSSTSNGGSLTLPVDPGQAGWMTYAAPVEQVTGTFHIVIGNDTWNMPGVYFDMPKPAGTAGGILEPHELPIGSPGIPTTVVASDAR